MDLVNRYQTFRLQHSKSSASVPENNTVVGTVGANWDFDETIRGTIKGAPVEFDLGKLEEDVSVSQQLTLLIKA